MSRILHRHWSPATPYEVQKLTATDAGEIYKVAGYAATATPPDAHGEDLRVIKRDAPKKLKGGA